MFYRFIRRFKLNSIGYGPRTIGVIGLLIAGIPVGLYGIYLVLGLGGINASVALALVKPSLIMGSALLSIFVILLVIEFAQDHYLDSYYAKRRHSRLRISDQYYECQSCGHQKIRKVDHICPVCGTTFVQDDDW
jgi:ribosomal protein L32